MGTTIDVKNYVISLTKHCSRDCHCSFYRRRTSIPPCVNGDIAFLWEWPKFDHAQNPNPSTDYDKTIQLITSMRHTRNPNLVQIGCKAASGNYVKYKASSFLFLTWKSDNERYCCHCEQCSTNHRGKLRRQGPLRPIMTRSRMTDAYTEVRNTSKRSAERNKQYYDCKVRPQKYSVGQWVYYFNPRKTQCMTNDRKWFGRTSKSTV